MKKILWLHLYWGMDFDRYRHYFLTGKISVSNLNLNELQYNRTCQILFRVHESFHFQNHHIMPKNKVIWISLSNYKTFQKKDSVVKTLARTLT